MAIEVRDALDRIDLAVELDLVRLHHLLDRRADVTQTNIDAGSLLIHHGIRWYTALNPRHAAGLHWHTDLDASVGGVLGGVQQRVELGIERHREGAINDAPYIPVST